MALTNPFEVTTVPQELVCEFFAVFMRFEYAMKATGFRQMNPDRQAGPAWQMLCEKAVYWLDVPPESELAKAIGLLISPPPPKVENYLRGWEHRPLKGKSKFAKALDAAIRVRKNLFHDGKHDEEAAPGRDAQLVRAALCLISAVVDQENGDLKQAFNVG